MMTITLIFRYHEVREVCYIIQVSARNVTVACVVDVCVVCVCVCEGERERERERIK
jgi:hypothetical protein